METLRIMRVAGEYHVRQVMRKPTGKWLRHQLVSLGPTFVKLGQFLSTRTDIVDKEVARELAYLQDDIQPLPASVIKTVLEEELKRPVQELFSDFEDTPLASASIGQVHLATLKRTGERVVIKVQRPGIEETIRADLKSIKALNNLMSFTSPTRTDDVSKILGEYERFLIRELDFRSETKNMIRFKALEGSAPLVVPSVTRDLCTQRVVVMQYVPSIKITNVEELKQEGFNAKEVTQMLVQLFLYQIADAGIVHCDPHPGNVGVVRLEDGAPCIVLYDYGNVVYLDDAFRSRIKNLVFAIYQRDVDEFVDLLKELRILEIRSDQELFEIRVFFTYFFQYLQNLDLSEFKLSVMNNELLEKSGTTIRIEQDFLSLLRVFSLLDGTCIKLDPKFNYIDALSPYSSNAIMDIEFFDYKARKDWEKVRSFSTGMRRMENMIIQMGSNIRKTESRVNMMPWMLMSAVMFSDTNNAVKVAVMMLSWLAFARRKN